MTDRDPLAAHAVAVALHDATCIHDGYGRDCEPRAAYLIDQLDAAGYEVRPKPEDRPPLPAETVAYDRGFLDGAGYVQRRMDEAVAADREVRPKLTVERLATALPVSDCVPSSGRGQAMRDGLSVACRPRCLSALQGIADAMAEQWGEP